jgi:hypothetical protein
MKIRKFNEAISAVFNKDYIEECFLEFIDDSNYTYELLGDSSLVIRFNILDEKYHDGTINGLSDSLVYLGNMLDNINVGLEKIKIKYPDTRYYIEISDDFDTYISYIRLGLYLESKNNAHKI